MKPSFLFLIFTLLLFSCHKEPKETETQDTLTNCNTIYIRQDGNNTFYENNPTYNNIESTNYQWKFSNFNEANIDSLVFNSGTNILENHTTLFSFLLIRNNKIVYEKYFNGSDKNQSNNIHSASKCILSALIGIAIDKGIIDGVDQKVLDFFPQYIPNNTLKKEITIKHLLNMTSGLDWEEDNTEYSIEILNNWTKAILDLPLVNSPGTTFNYATGNTHLLSAILSKASDTSTCTFLYTNLMTKLGIVVEHWGKDPQGYFSGGYNFYITPRELAQFGLLYANNGMANSNQIIPTNWINTSRISQINVDSDYGYSYGWWITNILGNNVYKAWGYGGQYICLIPSLDIVIVSTANTNGVYNPLNIDSFIAEYVIPAIQ